MADKTYFENEERLLEILGETLFNESGQHGATEEQIEAAGTSMIAQFGLDGLTVPPIPEDYAAFLKLTNGYAWNGIRFYSTEPVEMGEHYVNPSLYERNDRYLHAKLGLDGCLVLGDLDDDLFIYSAKTGKYDAVDELTLIREDDEGFDTFEDLFFYAYWCVADEGDSFFEPDGEV